MIKKPTLRIQEPQPRNIQRADIAPANGYAMVVDGHFKTQFSEEDAANTAASELLANFPMLQVEIYNAKEKSRMLVKDLASRRLIQRSDDPIGRLGSDQSCPLPSTCRCRLVGFFGVLFSGSLTADGQ